VTTSTKHSTSDVCLTMLKSKPCSHPWFHSAVLSSHSSLCGYADLLRASISTSRAVTPTGAGNRECLHVGVHSKFSNKQKQNYHRLLPSFSASTRHFSKVTKETIENDGLHMFTSWMPLQMPNQQCQSTRS